MTPTEFKRQQKLRRDECLHRILTSKSPKKLIVAGAGTGKTFTFCKVLEGRRGGDNLAMTFIKRLVAEMEPKLGPHAEVKTFHAYCKKILHSQNGKVQIAPFLTKLIEKDTDLLGRNPSDFDAKFQILAEDSPEVEFYLRRGDYYDAVKFDDAVFRLYRMLRDDPGVLPTFDQIVIDEFQDFHPLEVAFIAELAKKGDILIVGDDDQAVYPSRNASPLHLRQIHQSGAFETFELPFCSRCTDVVVRATNSLIERAQKEGHFADRIPKHYECYLEDKEKDSFKYPKIIIANCTTAQIVAKYVQCEIAQIDPSDIAESHVEDKNYPTALIIGPKQYLQAVAKQLSKAGVSATYEPSEEIQYGIIQAYEWLLQDANSNLGWRILAEVFFDEPEQKRIVGKSETGVPLVDLLDRRFIEKHRRALELIRSFQNAEQTLSDIEPELKSLIDPHFAEVAQHFAPKDDPDVPVVDKTKPTVLLTSFVGSKGLSAGHVFIVGVHNDSMPRDPANITDVEISQFVVALTRTRKQCQIVSNDWLIAPVDRKGKFLKKYSKSALLSWIPQEFVEERGGISAKTFK